MIEQWVWFYFDKGFSVIPLGVNRHNEEKKPSLTSWEKYKNEKPTREEIQKWLDEGLFKNVGIVCGAVSGDLVIIDIDDETIPDILKINWGEIKKTGSWGAKTGRGFQIWCRHHSNPGGVKRLLKYSIEYRANDGYCVAPPSIHPNGKQYHFIEINDYTDLPELITKDVQSIFKDMKKKIGDAWNIEERTQSTKIASTNASTTEYPKCVERALDTITKHPMRYNTIYGIASCFYFKEIPIDMAMQRIKKFNLEKCVPPKSNDDIEQIVRGAYQKESKRFGCEFWMDDAGLCPYENIMECRYGRKKAKKELASSYKIFTYKEVLNKKTGETFFVKDGVVCPRLAKLILNEYGLNFLTTKDNREIFYYDDGCYHNNGEIIISPLAEEYMDDISTSKRKTEIIDFIKDYNYVDRNIFDAEKNLINLENGVYDIQIKKLLPHTPNKYFLNKIPIKYNEEEKCPKILKFLGEVIYKDDVPVLQEFFGYCLYRRYSIHKAAMFLGGGKNGKSTVIRLLIKLLGETNVANKSLQDLIYNRFSKNALYGKLLNASADISDQALKNTGDFKQLTGEDRVDAEKKFKESYGFTNYAKFLFSANTLPKSDDESYAFYRRWILISFPYTFEGKNCNPNILEEITTDEELSGLLNWALVGLDRLLRNGDFSYNKTVEEVMEQYKTMSDPIYAFCTKFLKTEMNKSILKADLWEKYVNWCKKNKLPVIQKNILTGVIAKYLPELRTGKSGGKGHQKPAFYNISWVSEDTPDTKPTGGINSW